MLKGYCQIKFKPKVVGCVFQIHRYTYRYVYISEGEMETVGNISNSLFFLSKKKIKFLKQTVSSLPRVSLDCCPQPSLAL